MDVLVVGAGGREHALALALRRDPTVDTVHAAPTNPGIAEVAEAHPLDISDNDAIADLAEKLGVDLVIIGPEAPLVAGAADAVRSRGITCFGPSRQAARIEGSKAFAKEVMAAAGVPTAMAHVCEKPSEVATALDAFGPPYVVKADGLAAGKGVVVTVDRDAALAHAEGCDRVVVEEFLDGPEVSLFALTDGATVIPMLPAQDFKRVGDNDEGPNTGGMGAYAPLPWAPPGLVDDIVARVVQPTVDELRRRGTPFAGLLYAGLALTSRGLRVVEFNARFGDPETQVLLPLLRTPLAPVLLAAATGTLSEVEPLRWHAGAAVTVVISVAGYPDAPRTGDVIEGLDDAAALDGVEILHAGTTLDAAGRLSTSGGRVLAVTAQGSDLASARDRAYAAVSRIHIAGSHHRRDIAARAVQGEVRTPGM
ncbi:phosphoribosylamine--glycine ligase [Actinopolymorpha sp. B17G11]|uniref:phosphoribosylamine--glycine ligase n=1 Tax=unclassified Actinopolymorpha TaxID=2627063 RepID=UPI0032D98AB9